MAELAYVTQTDSRLLGAEFEYLQPATPAEALAMLAQYRDQGVRPLAGGTDLIVKMKSGALSPRYVMYIKDLQAWRYIEPGDGLKIGAVTSLMALQKSTEIRDKYVSLHEAIRSVAGPAVRSMGTLGGNVCNASPSADAVGTLISFGATCRLSSAEGDRVVPVEGFATGPGRTVLAPGELLTEVSVPDVPRDSGSSFLKLGRVAADIAKVNVAVYLERSGDRCLRVRIVLGAVGPTHLRAAEAEGMLADDPLSPTTVAAAARVAATEGRPITDVRSTAEYRRQVTQVLVAEAIATAWARSGGEWQ